MKTRLALAGLVLPITALAAPVKSTPKAAKTAVMYECQKCHMKVSAAVAKKDNYKDPMDGGKLISVKTVKK